MIAVSDLSALGIGLGPDPELASIRREMRARAGLGFSVDSLLRGAVRSATFRSNVTPSVTWDPSAPSAPVSPDGSTASEQLGTLGRYVQPTVDVTLADGSTFTVAPAGPATGDYRVIVGGIVVGVAATFLGAVLLGYWLGRRSRKRGRR